VLREVEILSSMDVRDIIKSGEHTILLLRTYAAVFLNGGQPGNCESCIRSYHSQIIKFGKMKAELLEKIKNRKCVPAWSGIKYIPGVMKAGKWVIMHAHIDSATLTDEQAKKYLNAGALKKTDFAKLPESEKPKKEVKKEVDTTAKEVKKEANKEDK
jgi:hypothetical protein